MVHERRGAEVAGEEHVRPGAVEPCLGHATLLYLAVCQFAVLAVEVVGDEVGLVDDLVQLLVDGGDVAVGAGIGAAELVDLLSGHVVVLVAASPVELVSGGVEEYVDGRGVAGELAIECHDLSIERDHCRLGIVIRLVEILVGDDAFLGNVQKVLVARSGCKERQYNGHT